MGPSSGMVGTSAPRRRRRGFRQMIRMLVYRLRSSAGPMGMAFCLFLCTFVRWFGIPSPFAAAFLTAVGKPPPLMLLGLGASLGLRLLWTLELDAWQHAGCALLWLILQKCRPRPGVETAALAGVAMVPRVLASAVQGPSLQLFLDFAALPMAMLFAMVLRIGMDAAVRGAAQGSERACLLTTVLLTIGGLGYFGLFSVNLGQLAAVTAALAFAGFNGPVYGVAGGLAAGLALALSGHDSRMALVLALGGLLGGLPPLVRMRWLCIPGVLACNLLGWFIGSTAHPPLSWWTAAAGALIWMMTPSRTRESVKPFLQGVRSGDNRMEHTFITHRIAHMRDAICSLAHALPNWEEGEPTAEEELGSLLCQQCINRELCWGRSRPRTEKMLCAMMELSSKGEAMDESTLPMLAEHGCLRSDTMAEAAHEALMNRQRRRAAMHKTRYEREITLTHLAALSGTLGELGALAAGESFNDLRAAHVISLALEELNIPARLHYARRVDGHLQAALGTESMMPIQKPLEQLLHYLAREEDLPLAISRSSKGCIELEEIPLYSAAVGMASVCAEGDNEGLCGDVCCAKRCDGGRMLLMLCDGMGHGEQAHRQSEKTQELLLLLLEAGYTRRQAITAVNGIMLGAQETERFSTVDLADVDLWTGEVYGEKLGACASWIVRGNHLKKVEGSSLPLGILQEASPTAAQYRLHSGDILVMMSDGVSDVFSTDEGMKKALEDSLYIQPQRMADALLRNALLAGGGTPRDDMSVMVLLLMDRHSTGT